jgi:hypothetical protein
MAQVILAMLVILDVFPLEVGAAASGILNPGEKKRRKDFPILSNTKSVYLFFFLSLFIGVSAAEGEAKEGKKRIKRGR